MKVKELSVNIGIERVYEYKHALTKLTSVSPFFIVEHEGQILDPEKALRAANDVNRCKAFLKRPFFRPEKFEYIGKHRSLLIFKRKGWEPKKAFDIELPSGQVICLTGVEASGEEHCEYPVKFLLKQGEILYKDNHVWDLPKESCDLLELLGICFIKVCLGDVYTEDIMFSNYHDEFSSDGVLTFGSPGK